MLGGNEGTTILGDKNCISIFPEKKILELKLFGQVLKQKKFDKKNLGVLAKVPEPKLFYKKILESSLKRKSFLEKWEILMGGNPGGKGNFRWKKFRAINFQK